MPLSTNAPFNEQGYSQVLRDIEQLYMKVQELYGAAGDLNPGGGQAVSQGNADDAIGTLKSDLAALRLAHVLEVGLNGTPGINAFSTLTGSIVVDTEGGWSGSAYTVSKRGVYLISGGLSLNCQGVLNDYASWSVHLLRNGSAFSEADESVAVFPLITNYTRIGLSILSILEPGDVIAIQAALTRSYGFPTPGFLFPFSSNLAITFVGEIP